MYYGENKSSTFSINFDGTTEDYQSSGTCVRNVTECNKTPISIPDEAYAIIAKAGGIIEPSFSSVSSEETLAQIGQQQQSAPTSGFNAQQATDIAMQYLTPEQQAQYRQAI